MVDLTRRKGPTQSNRLGIPVIVETLFQNPMSIVNGTN